MPLSGRRIVSGSETSESYMGRGRHYLLVCVILSLEIREWYALTCGLSNTTSIQVRSYDELLGFNPLKTLDTAVTAREPPRSRRPR